MIVGQDAAALRGRVERDAGRLDEVLQLGPGLRPDHAAARQDDRLARLAQRLDELLDLAGFAHRPRAQQRPAAQAPVDQAFVDLGVEDVAGEIEIDRAGLAGHRLLERVVDLLGDALEVVDAVRPLGAGLHDRDLIDFLEHLAAELADRARAADRDHRRAVDERVGDARRQVDHARAARRHAHAGLLQQPAIGLRHEGGGLLVPHVERADAFLDARGLGEQHRAAHQEIEDVPSFSERW